MDSPRLEDDAPAWVICLCAEWCNVCRDWRPAFDQAAREHPTLRFAWVDVEDEDESMGDVDIETFPTLLVAKGSRPLFLGPVQPSAAQVARLLAGLMHPDTNDTSRASHVSDEAGPLLARLQAAVLPKP